MKAFSLYKFWATVLVVLCTSVLSASLGWAAELTACEQSWNRDNVNIDAATNDDACREMFPGCEKEVTSCIRKAKREKERKDKDEGKEKKTENNANCDKAVKTYKDAISSFNGKCVKTGIDDCYAAARECNNRKDNLAGGSTFSDIMKTSIELYGVSMANQRGLNSNQVSTAQRNCPQMSFKSYFDRKKELDEKIDKKTRDLEKAEKEASDKKQKDIPEAIEKANEKIKDLDDKLVKLREEISKEKDESRKKKLDEDQKQAENEQAMLRKLLEVQKKAELDAANAAMDSKLLREQLGLEPSAKENDASCMQAIQSQYQALKRANGRKGFSATSKNQLIENFKKCQATQELELKKKWASLNKANMKAQADQKSYDDQIRELNEAINKSKNFALTSKNNGDAALQSIENSAATKEQNLLTNRDKTAQTDNAKITALYESITASGEIMKKAANLKAEIYKAQQELQLLGPVPVDGYEKGSYTDVSNDWDAVKTAQENLEAVVKEIEEEKGGLCIEGKKLIAPNVKFTDKYNSSGSKKSGTR